MPLYFIKEIFIRLVQSLPHFRQRRFCRRLGLRLARTHRGDRTLRAHAFSPRELQDQIAATLAV